MILGIVIMAVPFIMRWVGEYRSNQYISQFEEDKDEKQDEEKPAHEKKKDALLNEEGVIGIIKIPSLKLKYPIFEGAAPEQLNEGIGHMTETEKLCETGNCVLCFCFIKAIIPLFNYDGEPSVSNGIVYQLPSSHLLIH